METLALSKQSLVFLRKTEDAFLDNNHFPYGYINARHKLARLSRLAIVDQETSDALDARLAKQEKWAKRILVASQPLFAAAVFALFIPIINSGVDLFFSIVLTVLSEAVFAIISLTGIREWIVKSLHLKRGSDDPSLNRTLWERSVDNLEKIVNDPINQVRYFTYEIGHELESLLERYNYLVEAGLLGQATPAQQKELWESGPVVKQIIDTFEWLVEYYNWLVKGKSIGAHPPTQPSIAINLEEVLDVVRGLTKTTAPDEINNALEESADALRANRVLQNLQIELGNLPSSLIAAPSS